MIVGNSHSPTLPMPWLDCNPKTSPTNMAYYADPEYLSHPCTLSLGRAPWNCQHDSGSSDIALMRVAQASATPTGAQ